MRTVIASTALILVLSLAGPARAQVTIDWLENGSNTNLGLTSSFTESGLTVTATAYTGGGVNQSGYGNLTGTWSASTGSSNHLYAKDGGGSGNSGETGLGLTSDTSGDHEITYGHAILIDFSNVSANQPYTITFGSVQSSSGDKAGVYDISTGKLVGTIDSGGGSNSITIGGTGANQTSDFQYLITEVNKPGWRSGDSNPNILLGTLTLTPGSGTSQSVTPEPSTFSIGVLGALAFIGYGFRRRSKA
jgi:PEP-CTERM motif